MPNKPPVKVDTIETEKITPKNREVLRVGAEQLERYDDSLRALQKQGGDDLPGAA